jgi:hypothetical protein
MTANIQDQWDDVDRYIDAVERISRDPDHVCPTDTALLKSFAMQGAAIGLRHGAPRLISVDAEFIRGASC